MTPGSRARVPHGAPRGACVSIRASTRVLQARAALASRAPPQAGASARSLPACPGRPQAVSPRSPPSGASTWTACSEVSCGSRPRRSGRTDGRGPRTVPGASAAGRRRRLTWRGRPRHEGGQHEADRGPAERAARTPGPPPAPPPPPAGGRGLHPLAAAAHRRRGRSLGGARTCPPEVGAPRAGREAGRTGRHFRRRGRGLRGCRVRASVDAAPRSFWNRAERGGIRGHPLGPAAAGMDAAHPRPRPPSRSLPSVRAGGRGRRPSLSCRPTPPEPGPACLRCRRRNLSSSRGGRRRKGKKGGRRRKEREEGREQRRRERKEGERRGREGGREGEMGGEGREEGRRRKGRKRKEEEGKKLEKGTRPFSRPGSGRAWSFLALSAEVGCLVNCPQCGLFHGVHLHI